MASEKQIKKAFDVFDIEEEGCIPSSELENALRIAKLNPTPSDVERIKEELSITDVITFDQFKEVAEEMGKIDQVSELKEAFCCFDPNGNGYISKEKLREIVAPMLGEDLAEEEFQSIIDSADLDGDGKIDIDEFVEFMMGGE